ncbi:hypothetical protein OESDEN_05006 [Oesophagostomum dentatum]|uniref:NFACT RNA-binding domain-containing protein n=1 Tax=Oesophagostomum dentatum TaxID=61180 RepID=A0A0B1TI25_OESDE|nr:hypothetical protein OESDEN_05006 [Oesophagostomum dentatum]
MHAEAVENGDPVAEAIAKFDLNNNRIIMRLRDGEEGTSPKDVPVSIDMNAYGNACSYYKGMKDAAEKRVRTEIAAEKAIKNAEEKALTTIKKANVNVNSAKARKEMWFEKFTWFISSESYVVVCGRDATQNELLVKKYLRPEDIYVHAEAHGAASVVIRNRPGGGEIPPKTLTEAAQMATCFTKAWGSQVAPSSWWVYAHQVSKVTQTGEYLTKGSFVIRGKKNFLPSCPLSLGFGILFRVDEVSAQKYQKQLQEQLKNQRTAEVKEEPNENVPPTQKAEDECPALASDGEYPDISLDVPLSRLQLEDKSDEVSVIDIAPKQRKKAKVPTKELETKEYLEKKAEEERKAAAAKKIGKRQKHKLEKIRKKYADQDDEEREVRMNLLGSRGKKKNTADKGKQEAVFSPKTQSSKSNRDEGKCETAKSTKKESSPQAYMEFEVCDGKDKRYQLKTQVHPEHGEDVVSASTQNSKLDCRDIPTEAMQNSGFDHDNAVSDRTQKTVTESEECVSEATQSTGLDLENSMLEATQNTESNHDDSGLETAQNTELDEGDIGSEYNLATLDSTQTTELDRGDIGSESTESFGFSREVNESGDHRDVRFDREANENGHHPGAEGSADDDLPSESTQSLGQDHEASGNLSDHDPEHALADEKPLDVTQEDEEAHKQELQGPEEDDAEDDLKEFAATEGTEVLIAQLVSNPDPEDVLLYAVPMVGPYQAFHNFKYKVKITPGTTRKGKAGKAAVDLFLRNKNAGQVEKELIRAMAGDDKSWTNIPSGCRVSAPQLHAKK